MGSVTVGAGAAAGVFERESDLLSESRSAMATQVHCVWHSETCPAARHSVLLLVMHAMHAASNTPARIPLTYDQEHGFVLIAKCCRIGCAASGAPVLYQPTCKEHSLECVKTCCGRVLALKSLTPYPYPQELTRHAANLGMLAAATVNPEQRKHFYLGFQAEHKLAYSGAPASPAHAGHHLVLLQEVKLHASPNP